MNPNLKSHIQYFAGLAIGFALLSAACWVDGAYAAQPSPQEAKQQQQDRMADRYAQAVYNRLESVNASMEPGKLNSLFLDTLANEYDARQPHPKTCEALKAIGGYKIPCQDYYWAFWRAYKAVDQE